MHSNDINRLELPTARSRRKWRAWELEKLGLVFGKSEWKVFEISESSEVCSSSKFSISFPATQVEFPNATGFVDTEASQLCELLKLSSDVQFVLN